MAGKHNANQCKSVFSEYGWLDTLISNNSSCYTSQEFMHVMQAFSVNNVTSSLHYLQLQGLAEKYVQIVKCLFNKAKEEGKDFHKCLLIYCNTPFTGSLQCQCRSCKAGVLGLRGQCPMLLEISLDSSQRF